MEDDACVTVTQILVMFWTPELLLGCYLASVSIILAEFSAKNVVQDLNRKNGTKIQMPGLSSVNVKYSLIILNYYYLFNLQLATVLDTQTNAYTLRKLIC